MAAKYLYVPVSDGSSDRDCEVYRMPDADGIVIERVGSFRSEGATREIVELLNGDRKEQPVAPVAPQAVSYAAKRDNRIAVRVCELLGLDYATVKQDEVVAAVATLKPR